MLAEPKGSTEPRLKITDVNTRKQQEQLINISLAFIAVTAAGTIRTVSILSNRQ